MQPASDRKSASYYHRPLLFDCEQAIPAIHLRIAEKGPVLRACGELSRLNRDWGMD